MPKQISQHTPGPWEVSKDGNDVENAEGAGVCALYADKTADANAALIAAAPELLATVKAMIDNSGCSTWNERAPKVFAMARAAIAKAEGRDV